VSNPTKETNKYVELVRKWVLDPSSVSVKELQANEEAAFDDPDRTIGVHKIAVHGRLESYRAADLIAEFDKMTSEAAK
jgi:hypothetical protein